MFDESKLYAVGTEKFRILEEAIEHTNTYDEEVGKQADSKKSVSTWLMSEQKEIKRAAKRQKIKQVTSEKQMGYQLSEGKQRNCEVQNLRAAKATITMPLPVPKSARVVSGRRHYWMRMVDI